MRRYLQFSMLLPVLAIAACGGRDAAPMDEALRRDLAMAASAQPMMPQQFMSPTEMAYGQQFMPPHPAYGYQYAYAQPQPQPVRVVYRNAPTQSAPAPAPAPQGTRIVQRNTVRDAAIGAGVGAVAGAAIKGNTKGALVGAAIGGVIGGVIGHTVDVKRQ